MHTCLSHFLLQCFAIVGLTAIAIGQTDAPSEKQDVQDLQDVAVVPEQQSVSLNSSSSILKKFEEWVGLTDSRLEDLAAIAERVQIEIAKKQKEHSPLNNILAKAMQLVDKPSSALAPPAAPIAPSIPRAEISANESFESVLDDSVGEPAPMPVLNGSTPEWVKNGLVLGDDHSLAISSTLLPELDQCFEDLKLRMLSDVHAYLDKHVLEFVPADKLQKLTLEYVEKYWVKKGQLFDNIQDRPSGTYHQLWIGLHISSEQLAKIREWEKQCVREERTKRVGAVGGLGVFCITLLSGAVGLFARREKAKLKK